MFGGFLVDFSRVLEEEGALHTNTCTHTHMYVQTEAWKSVKTCEKIFIFVFFRVHPPPLGEGLSRRKCFESMFGRKCNRNNNKSNKNLVFNVENGSGEGLF